MAAKLGETADLFLYKRVNLADKDEPGRKSTTGKKILLGTMQLTVYVTSFRFSYDIQFMLSCFKRHSSLWIHKNAAERGYC